jgi:hypothetical protein
VGILARFGLETNEQKQARLLQFSTPWKKDFVLEKVTKYKEREVFNIFELSTMLLFVVFSTISAFTYGGNGGPFYASSGRRLESNPSLSLKYSTSRICNYVPFLLRRREETIRYVREYSFIFCRFSIPSRGEESFGRSKLRFAN